LDPWLFGPDDYDSDNSYGYTAPPADAAPYAGYGAQGYGMGPELAQPFQPQPAARPAYIPSASNAPPSTESAVMLIFKDGRPPEQIHNYMVTSRMLTVLDSQVREIPLDEVDIAATESANRAAGIDFQVPPSR
jgi:hypothetical protein